MRRKLSGASARNKNVMKNRYLFSILITMLSLFLISACEKAEVQSNAKIHARTDCPIEDCSECDPVEDCCCAVQLLSDDNNVQLDLCGTTGPCLSDMACEDDNPGTCPDILGFIQEVTLTNQFSTVYFCVAKNSPFAIKSASTAAQVRVSCRVGQTTPNWVTINLNTPPDKPYWETDGNCDLTACF
jgi:hypothetical protein